MPTETVESLKKEIEALTDKLNTKTRLSAKDKQLILDEIADKKRAIEKLTKEEKRITPIVNAPTISERTITRASIFIGSNKVRL